MILIYGKDNCTYCQHAKRLLENYDVEYEYIDVVEGNLTDWLKNQQLTTVPQIWESTCESEKHIGGFTELQSWLIQHLD